MIARNVLIRYPRKKHPEINAEAFPFNQNARLTFTSFLISMREPEPYYYVMRFKACKLE
jgi:hypothetical protein